MFRVWGLGFRVWSLGSIVLVMAFNLTLYLLYSWLVISCALVGCMLCWLLLCNVCFMCCCSFLREGSIFEL